MLSFIAVYKQPPPIRSGTAGVNALTPPSPTAICTIPHLYHALPSAFYHLTWPWACEAFWVKHDRLAGVSCIETGLQGHRLGKGTPWLSSPLCRCWSATTPSVATCSTKQPSHTLAATPCPFNTVNVHSSQF